MHVTVTFRHMDSSDALREYAEEKSERLLKYLVEPVEIHWVLSVEKIRHIAEATIVAKDVSVKAQEETRELYSAIDNTMSKLEKQVKKHKEKIKKHKFSGDENASVRYAPGEESVEGDTSTPAPKVVEKENRFAKPMSLDEATLQINLIKGDFLVYTDSVTNNINLLYKRRDGDLGLIETTNK